MAEGFLRAVAIWHVQPSHSDLLEDTQRINTRVWSPPTLASSTSGQGSLSIWCGEVRFPGHKAGWRKVERQKNIQHCPSWQMNVGWGQPQKSGRNPTIWECAASAPPDRGPACRERDHALHLLGRREKYNQVHLNDLGLESQTTLALPSLWGGSSMSLRKLLNLSEPQFNAYLAWLLQDFLAESRDLLCCYWVLWETNTY